MIDRTTSEAAMNTAMSGRISGLGHYCMRMLHINGS
jgi:hypothetical protein